MKQKSLTGSVFLIAGSCIGAGMLGLPIVSGLSGFFPSFIFFVFAWAFMLLAGLLFLEVNLRFGTKISFISMAKKTLGVPGQVFTWIFFLFLFYALTLAYISGSSSLIITFFQKEFGMLFSYTTISILFTAFFGLIIYLGTNLVVAFNRYLFIGLIVFYLLLIATTIGFVQPSNLVYFNWEKGVFALPVLLIAFGYQNMIPSLVDYYEGNRKKMVLTLVIGSILAFVLYLIWQFVVLGIVPVSGQNGIIDNFKQGREGAQAIIYIVHNRWIGAFSWAFAFFALTTSFLAQGLSLVDFLADGLKMKKSRAKNSFYLLLLALTPPLIFSLTSPGLFLKALGFGGGICATIIFGILPVLMCFKSRGQKRDYKVFGGNILLGIILVFAIFVLIVELINELGPVLGYKIGING